MDYTFLRRLTKKFFLDEELTFCHGNLIGDLWARWISYWVGDVRFFVERFMVNRKVLRVEIVGGSAGEKTSADGEKSMWIFCGWKLVI